MNGFSDQTTYFLISINSQAMSTDTKLPVNIPIYRRDLVGNRLILAGGGRFTYVEIKENHNSYLKKKKQSTHRNQKYKEH